MKRLLLAITVSLALLGAMAGAASATQRSETFTYGPIDVGAYSVEQRQDLLPLDKSLSKDAHITGMKVDVVDSPGGPKVPIQRLMLHHIVFNNLGRLSNFGEKQDATCGNFTMLDSQTKVPARAERFYAAGEERAELTLPPGYGYQTKRDDSWLMTWMLMNHRPRKDRAYIEYTVTYEDDASRMTPVKPYWFDAKNCLADPVYDVPGGGAPGSTHTKTSTFTMPESGRFVAGGGHVHGGAKNVKISQPDCGDRTLIDSRPAWGLKSHPFYNVKPVLHEPGPINMSGTLSSQGIPVAKGQRVKLSSNYDGERLHTRVMGILVAYFAPDASVEGCRPMPTDRTTYRTNAPHRAKTPVVKVPLTGIGPDGKARSISRPPGRTVRRPSGSTINVRDFFLSPANVSVRRGARLRWRFGPETLHNVTVANGPRGFSSLNLNNGRAYSKRLTKAGTYKMFCALHPVTMTQTVEVRKKR